MDREMSAEVKETGLFEKIDYSGQKFGITKSLKKLKKRIDLRILLYENSSKAFKEVKKIAIDTRNYIIFNLIQCRRVILNFWP